MKSIKSTFEKMKKKHPGTSDYIAFHRAIKGKGWSEQAIRRQFYKLVDPNEYKKSEARVLLKQLMKVSKKKINSGKKDKNTG